MALVRAPLISREGSLNNEASPAIGLAYIAGYLLKKGHKVEIVDGTAADLGIVRPLKEYPGFQIQGIDLDELVDSIPADADVIGFSSMFSCEWVLLKDLITRVRDRFPHQLLVGGGEHFTALSEYSLRDCPALDVIVKGEGEYTLTELIEAWSAGDYSEVGGICYLDADGELHDNGGLPRIKDIDDIRGRIGPKAISNVFGKRANLTAFHPNATCRCSVHADARTSASSVRARRCGRHAMCCVISMT